MITPPRPAPTLDAKAEPEGYGPVLVNMADVTSRKIEWLWPGRIPASCISLLVGKPGEGKSFLTMDLAARVTRGRAWPDGTVCPLGSVILIAAEDDPGQVIRPRLDAHEADVSRVNILAAVRRVDEDGKPFEVLFSLADVVALEQTLIALPDTRLVIVDPIGSFVGGKIDCHRDNEVRGVLAPVAKLAEKYGPAVLVVAHRRKSLSGSADDLALGSRAFTGIARAVWHVSADPGQEAGEGDQIERRLFLPGKCNLSRKLPGLAFKIAGEPPAIWWEDGPVYLTADQALSAEVSKRGPDADGQVEAAEWLRELLTAGAMPTKAIQAQAKDAGLAWRTVRRAADALKIKPTKGGFAGGGAWYWRLPPEGDSDPSSLRCPTPPRTNNLDILTKPGHLSIFTPENDYKSTPPQALGSKDVQVISLGHLSGQDGYSDGPPPSADDGSAPPPTDDDSAAALGDVQQDRAYQAAMEAVERRQP